MLDFFLKARTHTYASGGGKVKPAFPRLYQLEYKEKDWLYRDIYNLGNNIFMGLETVYFQDKPVLSISYFGNFTKMTEEAVDKILREALVSNWAKTRLWHPVEWKKEDYIYNCEAEGNLEEFSGTEKILKGQKEIYYFYYAGGFIG